MRLCCVANTTKVGEGINTWLAFSAADKIVTKTQVVEGEEACGKATSVR